MPYTTLPEVKGLEGVKLLEGLRVVDLTTSIAGPYATQLLADLGAEVIKIEKPEVGDDTRQWGPPFLHGESPWYLSVNRNKHSMTLDISRPEGLALLETLLERSDVLVVNMVSRVQQKLGVDYARLKQRFPQLIHASLTGFGLQGLRSHLPCYDLVAEGYSGVMDLTGEPENAPQKVGTPAADLLAGQDVALAVLAAWIARQRTGEGCEIDVSMQASMTRFMGPRLASYLSSGELPRRSGGRDSVIAIYQVFETADEPISLGLGNDAIWARFWKAVGRPEIGQDPRYASNSDRRAYRADIVEQIAGILLQRPRDAWLEIFASHRIPAGPINRLDEVVQDPDLLEKRFFYQVEGAKGKVPQIGLGIRINNVDTVHRKSPPVIGEDTQAILSGLLQLSAEQIQKLRDAGAV